MFSVTPRSQCGTPVPQMKRPVRFRTTLMAPCTLILTSHRLRIIPGQSPGRRRSWWIWRFIFGTDWPEWPAVKDLLPGPSPANRVTEGALRITPVGHATFLIQMDGLNILTDPIWSDRCSPVSWAGPKRHKKPGIRFEDLPPIDVVLVSHNHYDHLDLPTLKRLAKKGTPRVVVSLGNLDLVCGTGFPKITSLTGGNQRLCRQMLW